MKRHFKVLLFVAAISTITIFFQTISREIIERYNNSISGMPIPSAHQICYQLASR
jgi:hypothetical protein